MNSNISPIDLLVLVKDIKPSGYAVLSYFVFSPEKEIWIAYKGLKDRTTLGVHTLVEAVGRLEQLGILSVQRFPQGSGEVNRYRVNFKHLQSLIEERKAKAEAKRTPSIQKFSVSTSSESLAVPLSGSLSDPPKHPATASGLRDLGEPGPQIDPQYLTLAQRVQDGQVKPELLKWLSEIKMLSPSGDLNLHRVVETFADFTRFCSAFEQRVTEEKRVETETCSVIDGVNIVQFPTQKQDSTAAIINSLAKHFDSKGA